MKLTATKSKDFVPVPSDRVPAVYPTGHMVGMVPKMDPADGTIWWVSDGSITRN